MIFRENVKRSTTYFNFKCIVKSPQINIKYKDINSTSFYAALFPIELLPSEYEIGSGSSQSGMYFLCGKWLLQMLNREKINARKNEHKIEINYENHR